MLHTCELATWAGVGGTGISELGEPDNAPAILGHQQGTPSWLETARRRVRRVGHPHRALDTAAMEYVVDRL